MNGLAKFDATLGVSDVYVKSISELHKLFHLHTTIKILIVVDGSISLTEAPSGFGLGRVVRLLRESHIGCTHFSVDVRLDRVSSAVSERRHTPAMSSFVQGFSRPSATSWPPACRSS